VKPFFGALREPPLKGLFICGSDSLVDNPTVNALRPIPPGRRHALAWRHAPWGSALAALLLVGLVQPPAWGGDSHDHERARAAVEAGQVLPLPTLLERLRRTHPGQVLELELERDDGRWIYEIKLLQPNGQLLKLDVDAASAQVLQVRRKDERHAGRDAEHQVTPSKDASR